MSDIEPGRTKLRPCCVCPTIIAMRSDGIDSALMSQVRASPSLFAFLRMSKILRKTLYLESCYAYDKYRPIRVRSNLTHAVQLPLEMRKKVHGLLCHEDKQISNKRWLSSSSGLIPFQIAHAAAGVFPFEFFSHVSNPFVWRPSQEHHTYLCGGCRNGTTLLLLGSTRHI
jgi:hypothetical protein